MISSTHDQLQESPPDSADPSPVDAQRAQERNQQPHGLNLRSCVTCRRRKVKCNKENPCSNCVKSGAPCVFPAPGRAPRRPRQGAKVVSEREVELLKRLRRLEGVVEELSGQVEVETVRRSPSSDMSSSHRGEENNGPSPETARPTTVRVVGMDEGTKDRKDWMARAFRIGHGPPKTAFTPDELTNGVGRLVLDEGKSEYCASPFWASITEEMEEIRDALDDRDFDSDSDAPVYPLASDVVTIPDHQSFLMGYSSSDVNLKTLHPLPSQIPFYWQTFLDNVQPLTKIVHAPTMNNTIKDVRNHMDSLSKSTEALMFAIYFATITSMTAKEVRTDLGVDKDMLLKQYRFGVEQALARASFLNTNEIVTVQAFILFLVCVRRHDDTRFVWSLTGLALRIAQSLGLHRDGARFGLSPFDAEMRRRLWWQLCILDTRASDDHGSEPSVTEYSFDTALPLSINDEDLTQDATELPAPRPGVSEMTFCLIRYEICRLSRRLTYSPPGDAPCKITGLIPSTLEEKEQYIRDCSTHLETTYLQYCTDTGPLYWVAATVARLIVAKFSLIIYHPYTQPGKPNLLSQDIKDRLFMASVEILEYSHVLENEARTKQWGWLFHTYIQWHALAYLLGELSVRGNSSVVDRAWAAVDTCWDGWGGRLRAKRNGMLWMPMRKLMVRARRRREENALLGISCTFPERLTRPPATGYAGGDVYPGVISRDRTAPPEAQPPHAAMARQVAGEGAFAQPDLERILGMHVPEQLVNHNLIQQIADEDLMMGELGVGGGGEALDMNLDMENVEWQGWDEMMRDFQMKGGNMLGMETGEGAAGPSLGGMGGWW